MPDYKKNFRPGGNSRPFNKGGASRDFGPKELFDAEDRSGCSSV